jgi:hypothetical protein
MDLIRSVPKLFSEQRGPDSVVHGALYIKLLARFKEKNDIGAEDLAIELIQKASCYAVCKFLLADRDCGIMGNFIN